MSLRVKIWLGSFLVLFVSCSNTEYVDRYHDRLTTVTITEDDGQVTVSWEENVEPGSETSREGCSFNIYSAADPSLSIDNWAALYGGQKHENVTPPYTLSGLANGTTVYFLITMVCGGEETVLADLFSATPNQTTSAPAATPAAPAATPPAAPDGDGDGIPDDYDNCPSTVNANQRDTDGDGDGDACDADDDNDGVPDASDNCQYSPNPAQTDSDGDGTGDACEDDVDGDGVADASDNCPYTPNPAQTDSDTDGTGDACEPDTDGDGIPDDGFGAVCSGGANSGCDDNCINDANTGQEDMDGNGVGDACEPSPDSDPDPFTFTDVDPALRTTIYTSNTITVTGINVTANVTTSSGTLVINGADTGSSSGQVALNDNVAVTGITSSASSNTAVGATVTIGGVADTYSVTTYTAVAELSGTNACVACDLSGAYLFGANLYGANLYGANLFAAAFSSTDFSGATFYNTTWIDGNSYSGTCATPSIDTCGGVTP